MTLRPHIAAVGVTGAIGSGKSSACAIIAERYPVLDTDAIARDVMETDATVRERIIAAFGPEMYGPDGGLERKALAALVFPHEESLKRLNRIVHPATIARVEEDILRQASDGHRLVFVESALIYEAGIEEMFDAVLVIAARDETIGQRMRASGSLTEEQLRQRLERQLPADEKKQRADFTVHNDGSVTELRTRIEFLLNVIAALYA